MKTAIIASLALLVSTFGLFYFASIQQSNNTEVALLREQISKLEKHTQQSSDYIEIANLQAIYGYYVDKAQWDNAADLFTEQATLEIAGRGLFQGQERIRTYLNTRGELSYGRLYNHMQLQPVIHIDNSGDYAKARWRSFIQVGHLGQEARWGEATYNNEYQKEDGVWKINKLHSFITFYVEYDQGWNKGSVELPKKLDELAPDGEATVQYGAFPEVFLPPYHYDNPVSGRQ